MLNFIKKYFDYNQREIKRLQSKVDEINALEDTVRAFKDSEFKQRTLAMMDEVQSNKKTLDELLPMSYALVREASRRVLGMRHFDVQLIAGVALHEKMIVEQKTGEGKTLTATAPLYLNALTGKGVHLVTVNDYLARRDAGWMGTLFNFMGLSTAAMISDKSYIYDSEYSNSEIYDWRLLHLKEISRKEAYEADVTYGINSEFGFDYLRDNMASRPDRRVQRGFYYAIIDEADSVLIDEARTPHIISAPVEQDTSKYYQYAKLAKQLDAETDYVIDEKLRTASLTDNGISKVEKMLGVDNVYEQDFETLFHIEAALKAETLFKSDKEYIVKDGEVIIVDEFTGRLLQGRRFSEGIHQAIEAKEQVTIQKESKTLATVSLQNYFRMYEKLAGMTGTASTEAEEFNKIYKVDVVVIPTHRTAVRKDEADNIYKTEQAKYNAVVEDIAEQYKNGRPVLVGTTSIDKNEYLSSLLNKKGIPHELLNAKNHLKEAQIIARAGEKGSVTVATNMAGRGVDIILGGAPPDKEQKEMKEEEFNKEMQQWQKKHDEVVESGGLYVIGTERHESRRIDNQLRGRSGRQGDPGETRFYVSLQDDLMRIFGGEQISKIMSFLNFPEDQPLSHPMVSRAIEQAQVKVEGFNFDIRKHLVEFDDVLNKQREIVYTRRRAILDLPDNNPDEFKKTVLDIYEEEITAMTQGYITLNERFDDEDLQTLQKDIELIFPEKDAKIAEYIKKNHFDELHEYLLKKVQTMFEAREKDPGQQVWHDIVRMVFVSTIDKYWTEHLTAIEDLRQGINLRGYAQLDPLVEYKNEAFRMFENLIAGINFDVTRRLFRIEIQKQEDVPKIEEVKEKEMQYKAASNVNAFRQAQQIEEAEIVEEEKPQKSQPEIKQPAQSINPSTVGGFKVTLPGVSKQKLGRNDPCWCGSGKKYKKCHLNSDTKN